MPARMFRSLLTGPPAYAPATPWNAWAATGATLVLFVVALLAGHGASIVAGWAAGHWSNSMVDGVQQQRAGMVWLLAAQIIMMVTTLIAAEAYGGNRRDVLALHPPAGGVRVYVEALALLLLLSGVYNGVLFVFAREALIADLKLYVDLLRSPARWIAVPAIGVGAPVSEELMFRGFLLSALAASPLGFRRATLAVTSVWTALHVGYSIFGLAEVFLVGLFLAWLLWRTGSLLVPLVCHTIYNCSLLVALMLLPIKV